MRLRFSSAIMAMTLALCACERSSAESEPGSDAGGAPVDGSTSRGGSGGAAGRGAGGEAGSANGGGGGGGVDASTGLPACAEQSAALLLATKSSMPLAGSGGYVPPSAEARAALQGSIEALHGGDPGAALALATAAGYSLCSDSAKAALWRPLEPSTGAASVAWRAVAARPLIVEVPHPIFDGKTLEQAVELFHTLPARAIVVSGTHRCASTTPSACSGTTGVCSAGTVQSHRDSDMAHVDDSFFHAAHVTLAALHASDWVLGVHGMSDAGVSLSDGTALDTSASSPIAKLAAALVESFSGTPLESAPVTTCNAYAGAPAVEPRLCGTTDVQGRHLNGSPNACMAAAASSSSRFIHLEQSAAVRDNPALVAAAIDAVVSP